MQQLRNRPPLRIVIDEPEFRKLCASEAITTTVMGQRVEIALAPIEWKNMLAAVTDVMAAASRHPVDPPQAREFLTPRRPPRK